jgi:hypothetical protein
VVSRNAALESRARQTQTHRLRHVGLVMDTSSRAAVLASVGYLFLFGACLLPFGGLPAAAPLRLVAIHLFTLGFVAFMLYGLGEHLLPRFTGNPLRFGVWTWAQQALGHAGLVILAAGSLLGARSVMILGGALAWLALLLFTLRLLPMLWPGPQGDPDRRN